MASLATDHDSESTGSLPTRTAIVLTVLVPFGCGFYLSYLFRTVNAVISTDLQNEFGLDAEGLGFLTSTYFATFAVMQLVLGVLLDRYGPRRVQAALLVVAALGSALFAIGQDVATLAVARGLIGAGVSACLMAAMKANAVWWPKERLPLVNNVIGAFGSFGALSATSPMYALLDLFGWREIFAGLAVITLALAVAVYIMVPERRELLDTTGPVRDQFYAVLEIVRSPFFWRIGGMFIVCQAVLLSYQTLWAAPWLRDVARLGERAVADHMLLIQLGFFLGLLTGGAVTDRVRVLGIQPFTVLATGVAVYIALQASLVMGVSGIDALIWGGFGFFGAFCFLSYSVYSEHFPAALTARVLTAANLLLFVAAFALQWGIGAIVELFPRSDTDGHVAAGHTTALGVALALQIVAFAWMIWPRRKRA